jgi:thiamine pyrophosphate-dependent acetolactate synthase large subunit-like protein
VGGPLGYQGSKAGMKLIAQADVVLALGTRLGPFGTLPQHGLDYWPKNAKIIQVDADHEDARPGQEDLRRHLRRRQGRRRRRCCSGWRPHAGLRRHRRRAPDIAKPRRPPGNRNSTPGRTSATPSAWT